jgi:intracellular multiplication protein IcmK
MRVETSLLSNRRVSGVASSLLALVFAALPLAAAAQDTQHQPPPFSAPPGSSNPSYGAAEQSALPLTPGMIQQLAHRYHAQQQAISQAQIPQAVTPQTRLVSLSLGPSAVTNIVQTVQGYPSSISFVDSTGQPWPIAWTSNSAPSGAGSGVCGPGGPGPSAGGRHGGPVGAPAVMASGFNVCVPYKGSNTLEIEPMTRYPRGGLLVNLQNAPAPVTFLLLSGVHDYDARVTAQVDERGPDAAPEIISRPNAPEIGAPYLTAMLDGTPPASAVPLAVQGASPEMISAWRYNGQLYLRTTAQVLSPEWVADERTVGGVKIYELPDTPVVLMSSGGQTFSISFKED